MTCSATTSVQLLTVCGLCPPLMYQHKYGGCRVHTEKIQNRSKTLAPTFVCNNGVVIPASYVNDLFADCPGLDAEDEPFLLVQNRHPPRVDCLDPSWSPCQPGHPHCFSEENKCVYQLDTDGNLDHCRNGGHLKRCFGFDCRFMFKCPREYCVPYYYVCDGVWSCPSGEDELLCLNATCEYLFRCVDSPICVGVHDLCNGVKECLHGDDELMCSLLNVTCPSPCTCLAFALQCQSLNEKFQQSFPFVYLKWSGKNMKDLSFIELVFPLLDTFVAHNCNASQFCLSKKGNVLERMDLSKNKIKYLEVECLLSLVMLVHLNLSSNFLTSMKLPKLPKLHTLDISHNFITALTALHFQSLQLLSVLQNPFMQIHYHTLESTNVSTFLTDDFHICCAVRDREITCDAPMEWPSSCDDLLSVKSMKISIWIVSVFNVLINMVSMARQASKLRKNERGFPLLVWYMNCSDLLFGSYLANIGIANEFFQNTFYQKELEWRQHPYCYTISTVSLFSSLFYTLDHFQVHSSCSSVQ